MTDLVADPEPDHVDVIGTGTEAEVTVIVPARNEQESLPACLESIRQQSYRNLQIIVIDGASTDLTPEIVAQVARADGRVQLIHNPRGTIPSALNLGINAARGRWIVRVDAHSTIPPDYVRRAVDWLGTGAWGGVGGRKDGVGRTTAGRTIAHAMQMQVGVGNSMYHHGTEPTVVDHIPFGAYPTELVRQLGGWDERLLVNEDFEFDYRVRDAGYELLFDPKLVIHWSCRQSIAALFRQYHRYGRGKMTVVRLHRDAMKLRHAAPPLLVLTWLCGVALAARQPRRAALLLAPYALGIAAASRAGAGELGRVERRYVPCALVAMHGGWGLGFWQGAAREVGRIARQARSDGRGAG